MERVNFKAVMVFLAVISFFIIIAADEDCDVCFSPNVMIAKFFIVGLLFIGATFVYTRKWAVMDGLIYKITRQPIIPTTDCTGETPAQIRGVIMADDKTLESPHTKTQCVFYHYIKEKYVSDGDSSRWVVVENKMNHIPFDVVDSFGRIKVILRNIDLVVGGYKIQKNKSNFVDYDHSEVDAIKQCYRQSFSEHKKGFLFKIKQQYRVSEYVLIQGQNIFVNGWVHEKDSEKYIAEGKYTPLIITRKTKEKYLEDFAKGDNFFFTSNFVLLVGSTILFLLFQITMGLPFEYILVVLGLIFIRVIYNIYNRLVELKVRCSNAQSQILIELKKRNDLLPNLEKLVKTHAKYEKNMMKLVTELRMDIGDKLTQDKLNEYFEKEKVAKNLFAVAEKYPELSSNKLFRDFSNKTILIENNIAYFRGFFNKTVLKYNTLACQFPFLIIARIFGFREYNYYKIDNEGDKELPTIASDVFAQIEEHKERRNIAGNKRRDKHF